MIDDQVMKDEYGVEPCSNKCGKEKFVYQRICTYCLAKEEMEAKEKALKEAGYTRCNSCKTLLPPKQ